MSAVSLEKNWRCANLAIDLTTLALYFFIQLNPDRGKTKETHKEEDSKGKRLGLPSCSLVGKGTGNVWYLNNSNNWTTEPGANCNSICSCDCRDHTHICKFKIWVILHQNVLEYDIETANPLDDNQTAEWLNRKWKSVNALGSKCRWKWQLCWQGGGYDRLHYSLKLLLHFCLVNHTTKAGLL